MRACILLVTVLFTIAGKNFAATTIDTNVQNKNVERIIDLTTQLVRIQHKITVENTAKKDVTTYAFVIPNEIIDNLSYISVKDSAKKELKTVEEKTNEGQQYIITLANLSPNPILHIETIYTKSLTPHPTQIGQSERQLVRYFGNAHFFSPYKTGAQKTTVQLASKNVESFTAVKPSAQSESTLTYGPYESVAAWSIEDIVVHYENHTPFLTVTNLERVIEVSHWGNIAIEETIDIVHSGAVLKGSFSRYDFQKDTRSGQASVKSYKTILPASAKFIYYRDTNGNISTSAMRTLKDSVELDLRPRFPLFGGWRTHYTLGYDVPSFEYLFNNNDQYLLKLRLIDHIYDDMVIDEATIKIILPEGSANIKLITPYSVQRLPDELHYTYLDTFGRPVIIFKKKNLVENHIHDFNLKYTFPKLLMLQEPMLIVGFLYILFVLVIIWMRLDFSITKEKDGHQHRD